MDEESVPSVVEVRRNLNDIRKTWRASQPNTAFYSNFRLASGAPASHFAFRFVLSHHKQRDVSSRKSR